MEKMRRLLANKGTDDKLLMKMLMQFAASRRHPRLEEAEASPTLCRHCASVELKSHLLFYFTSLLPLISGLLRGKAQIAGQDF